VSKVSHERKSYRFIPHQIIDAVASTAKQSEGVFSEIEIKKIRSAGVDIIFLDSAGNLIESCLPVQRTGRAERNIKLSFVAKVY